MRVLCVIEVTEEEKTLISSSVADYEYIFDTDPSQELLESADIILGCPKAPMLRTCEKLQWLQTQSAGVDPYIANLPAGVKLTNATGGYGLAIGEHMMGMYLSIIKKLAFYRDLQNEHKWGDLGPVTSVYGSTVLVVGMGDIGTEFAKICKGMGTYVIGVRRSNNAPSVYADEVHLTAELDELLPKADCVAVCMPGTKETFKMFGKEKFGKMKDTAVFINIGRGSIVNQPELVDALNNGVIAGAALDVTDPEPLPAEDPLWSAKNVVITPHVSGGFHLDETKRRILNICCENLKNFADGKDLKNIVDFETGYRKL
ncbi:MAG: D-2-hydroxyacid dehydrogenase [Clostridia bacterium]|nr:D-2-hydroxyacid dehydrogenase [Clostridia bacterium]